MSQPDLDLAHYVGLVPETKWAPSTCEYVKAYKMSLQQRALIPAQDPEHKCINPDGVCPFMVEADRQARLLPYIHLVAHWFQRELDEERLGSEKLDPLSFFQTHADVFCHEQFFERASGLITEAYYDDHRNTAFYSIAMPGRAVDGDVEEWGK